MATYLTMKEVAAKSVRVASDDLSIKVTKSFFKLVDCLGNVVLSERLDGDCRHLVQLVPFEFFNDIDHDDEDYDILFDEYHEGEVESCVWINGFMIIVEGV